MGMTAVRSKPYTAPTAAEPRGWHGYTDCAPDYDVRDVRETRNAPPPPCVTAWGLPLGVLPEPELMSESDSFAPANADRRMQEHPVGARWLASRGYESDLFAREGREGWHTWRDVPSRVLFQVFSPEECRRLFWGSLVQSRLSERFEYDPLLRPQWQVHNSFWHYGWSFEDEYELDGRGSWRHTPGSEHAWDVRRYRAFAATCRGLRSFKFGDGFETYLNHVRGCGEFGLALWGRREGQRLVYLDGKLGLAVVRGGEHLLTVGVSPSARGLLVAQVQLRRPRGNRWLYKLGAPLVDYVLERLRTAFGQTPLWLVTGRSAAEAVRRSYGEGAGSDAGTLARVERLYAPPRSETRLQGGGREFALVPSTDGRVASEETT